MFGTRRTRAAVKGSEGILCRRARLIVKDLSRLGRGHAEEYCQYPCRSERNGSQRAPLGQSPLGAIRALPTKIMKN